MPKSIVDPITQHGTREVDREVHSVCPYCGVGCQLSYQIKDDKIAFVQGRNGYSNENRLCVKGRFGFDYVTHPQRLMKPLIRKPGLPKGVNVDPANPYTHFRQATWEEALDFTAKGLAQVAERHGNTAIAGFGSAKCTNQEAYLFQKLIRTRFRNNNVDHSTRPCHASSVAALLVPRDTYAVASEVLNLLVKTHPADVEKIELIKRLIADNLDIDRILDVAAEAPRRA